MSRKRIKKVAKSPRSSPVRKSYGGVSHECSTELGNYLDVVFSESR